MPFACIFVPDFPVEAVLRFEPELRAQAVAVLEGKPPLQKIFALNEKARRTGIDLGMTKLQVEACTYLALRSRSSAHETAAHAALLDCAHSFSPVVEDTAFDTLVLDLAGLEPLFGPLHKIARDIARRASDLGLEVNLAVASNPDVAMLAARGLSGVTVVPEEKESERLNNLPLEILFAGLSDTAPESAPGKENKNERLLETLNRWGIRNLSALAALPETSVAERLGQKGVHLQRLARGGVCRMLVPVDPPLIFEETVELEFPLVLLEPLALLFECMLDRLCARLASRALATQALRLQLELENLSGAISSESSASETGNSVLGARYSALGTRNQFTRTLHLPVPMLDAKVFLKLLQLDLKAHPPGAPIVKVHLSAEPSRPRPGQAGLFLPTSPEPEKLELTLARISGIVGENRVGAVEILDTRRPENFRLQHFAPAPAEHPQDKRSTEKENGKKNDHLGRATPLTALRIFRPPLRTTVTLRHGKPTHIDCRRRSEVEGDVVWLAGPWRSSGDWWQQEGWAREEWDIALQGETGLALYRLVRDLLSGGWFVEGTYD
jgi:protein ImuB